MQVKMLMPLGTADGCVRAGEIYSTNEKNAASLIAAGVAVPASDQAAPPAEKAQSKAPK
jgi:hypothetical protein